MQQRQPLNLMDQEPEADYGECLLSTSKRQRVSRESVRIVYVDDEHTPMEAFFSPLVWKFLKRF